MNIRYCPSTLKEGYNDFSPAALRKLFGGKKVSCFLKINSPEADNLVAERFRVNRERLSISGAQIKQSLRLDNRQLKLTAANEQGEFILKPVPYHENFENTEELPANEHLTMQIANQVFGINTAANGLVFFENNEPAYITRRFDIAGNGDKISQEDFSVLMGFSHKKNGNAFRYEGSYEDAANAMKKFVPAYAVESEKYFSRIIFNYLFSNGDAHLKNFSIQRLSTGDHILSPAYDLVNTRLHIKNDSPMALKDGLFSNDYYTDSFQKLGFYAYDDFFEFGVRIGLVEKRIIKTLSLFRNLDPLVIELIEHSYLSEESKRVYKEMYLDRLKALNNSYKGAI